MIYIVLIIAGGWVGLWLGDVSEEVLGLVAGAVIGVLFAQRHGMQKRIRELAQRVELLSASQAAEATVQPEPAAEAEPPEPAGASPEDRWATAAESMAAGATPDEVTAAQAAPEKPVEPAQAAVEPEPIPAAPTPLEKGFVAAKDWLTSGNVPVKIGVIVSFFGVAFLLKYAVERQVLSVPIELRYLGVAVGAAVMLGFGWRLRERLRVYALSLQGGGIGVLYLTIFGAFRLHPLLPSTFAFFLLVALTVFAGVLAVIQNARALAVLGITGGFLAPILISTGSGNHVGLFSYYLLLNAAVLGIAWFRAWRFLNLLGFVFTFGVGTLWGYRYYTPELFASTQPFLIAYFVFYQAIAILYAFRQPPQLRGLVDGTLIFGTPVIAFALQSRLVEGTEYGLAISAVVVAVFYTLIAIWLHRTPGKQLRLLIESYVALGVAFATIAIPLALDDRWTAVAWAMEGAALVWIGVRQDGVLARLTGFVLLGASGVAFMRYGWVNDVAMPVANGNFLGGMLIALSSLFSARYLAADRNPMRLQGLLSVPLLLWGLGWWLSTGAAEILDHGPDDNRLHLFTAFLAISAGALAWIARRFDWLAARRATLGYLPLLPVLVPLYLLDNQHFFEGFGSLAWAAVAAAHFGVLRAYDDGRGRIEGIWHFAGVLFLVGVFSLETGWWMGDSDISDVWAVSTSFLVPLAAAMLILWTRERLAWPIRRYWSAYLAASGVLIVAQLIGVGGAGLDNPGDPQPLPYLPLFNPFDVLTLLGLVVGLQFLLVVRSSSAWLEDNREQVAYVLWGAAAFVLTTISVVRGVHHFGDVPWQEQALVGSVSVQSALSIYWAMLGFGGMIWGARQSHRGIWLAGTGLMALVVIKLFLVDLGNTGTVARIVSFLGVGVLLLVVGYLAPAPPKQEIEDDASPT